MITASARRRTRGRSILVVGAQRPGGSARRGVRHRARGAGPTVILAALLGALALPSAVSAQELPTGCHCVDENGERIEDCRCTRLPDLAHLAPLPALPFGNVGAMAWSLSGERRARLGVTLGSPEGDEVGAPVEDVLEGGPAARAGLMAGDVIIALAGHELSEPVDRDDEDYVDLPGDNPLLSRLLEVLADLEPGEEVELAYLRGGERHTTTITPDENPGWERMHEIHLRLEEIGERMEQMEVVRGEALRERLEGLSEARARMSEEMSEVRREALEERLESAVSGFYRFEAPTVRWAGPGEGVYVFGEGEAPSIWRVGRHDCPGEEEGGFAFGRDCIAGAELVELNPSLGAYFGAERGVLVPAIDADSPLGLRAGDVIVAIDGRAVSSPEDVRRILASYRPDEEVTLRILREREAMDVRAHLGG